LARAVHTAFVHSAREAPDLVGALDDRWANYGVAGDDYLDWLRQR
jgi:hypothetical protein